MSTPTKFVLAKILGETYRIQRHLKAADSFFEVIDKMRGSGSPMGCNEFELHDYQQ